MGMHRDEIAALPGAGDRAAGGKPLWIRSRARFCPTDPD
jgi:hypothetical protein